MKTFNTKLVILLAAFSLLGVGCGESNSFQSNSDAVLPGNSGAVDSGAGVPVTPDSGGSVGSGTNQASFTPVSFTEFSNYVALHALNNPSNYKVTVNLASAGSNRFAGTVKISYSDAGNNYVATFTAGSGVNQKLYDLKDSGKMEAAYNYWYVLGGKTVFSGYFQDAYGAIVLVIDGSTNQGDGQGGGNVSGSIYYKNFAQSYATQSPYRNCWYIYDGPYDCRSSAVTGKASLYPTDNGYRKLGTFTGLSKVAAFGL